MRNHGSGLLRIATIAAAALISCHRSESSSPAGSGALVHPTLAVDYTSSFAGVWTGSGSVTMNGDTQSTTGTQELEASGFNTLTVYEVCQGVDGRAGLDSPTTFSMDPVVCPPEAESCGPVTIAYDSGVGVLDGGTLVFVVRGTATGCGASYEFSGTFTGTRSGSPPPPPVTSGPPNAVVASANVATVPAVPIVLDASGSSDPNGEPVTFAWSITAQPAGASPSLTGADTAHATFASSDLGAYSAQVVVTGSDGQTATATVSVTVAPPIASLSHEVVSARYSAALDRLVLTDASPSALYVYDPGAGTEAHVALPLAPQCLSLSPDGSHALVGHDAWISYVDLASVTLEKTIPISLDVGDCVLGGNGWAYLFPTSYAQSMDSVQIATGVESRASAIYVGNSGVLGPDGVSLYAVTNGLSPAQIYRYDLSGGPAVEKWGSPYWGNYAMSAPLWTSSDGARLFTAAATAFRLSSTQSQDLLYGGTLSGMGMLNWLDTSATEIAAIAAPNPYAYPPSTVNDTTVETFSADYLGHVGRITLPQWVVGSTAYATHGRFVFYRVDGSKVVVVQADPASGLLHDTAVLAY